MLLVSFLLTSCNNDVANEAKVDSSEWSGITNENDEKSKIVEKLAKGYTEGNFEIARDYFTPDGTHKVNNDVYTVDEIINGYNFHSLLYDEIQHIDPVLTTVTYNNGEVYTNHWSDWSGKSKITGEVQKNTFHCWWQWDGDNIVATQCYFDTSDIMAETKLYQEQNSQQ